MSEKRFQKTRIVDKWGGIYDSETDRVLNVNDVEHKLNEQLSIIRRDEMSIKTMMSNIEKLEKENEKLIQKNCIPCELVNLQTREIDNLKEENEQLKKQLEGDNL